MLTVILAAAVLSMYSNRSFTSLVDGEDWMNRISLDENSGTCSNIVRAVARQFDNESAPISLTLIDSKASKSSVKLLVNSVSCRQMSYSAMAMAM